MSDSLIEQILDSLSGDTLNKLGAAVGANPQLTQAALKAGVPMLLGGMLQKGSTAEGANDLLGLLTRGNHDSVLTNLAGALGGGDTTSTLLKTGATLLPALFGSRSDGAIDALARLAGLNRASSSSLLSLLAPLAMGFVTKALRSSGGISLDSLRRFLGGQRGYLRSAAPADLASVLGVRSLDDLGTSVTKAVEPKSGGGWLKWVIGALLLGVLLYALRNCSGQQKAVEAPSPAPAPAIEAPAVEPAAPVVTLEDLSLADGTTIRIAPNGVERQLLAFIQDPAQTVDNEAWFTTDRLEFDTDSATLRPSSDAQLDAIAAILRAYPNVKIKFGGYTDNTGEPALNRQLSADRAVSAMNGLISRGIAADRVEAEGYGAQFPVADNATEEGRQRNRRVDVRVTAK
jgi:outer membrane protein OmpA-like peptidoglycan-associated protein